MTTHPNPGRAASPTANQAMVQRFCCCTPTCTTGTTSTRSSRRWLGGTAPSRWTGPGTAIRIRSSAAIVPSAPLFADVLEDVVDGLGCRGRR